MYQLLLIWKYLTRKVMPLLSVVAVMLCTTMVLIVWSIMGGFLVNLLETGKRFEGDVTIEWPTVGFRHYEDLIDRLEARPEVLAAAPRIDAVGMLSLPDNRLLMVSVIAVDERFYRVTELESMLYWKPLDEPLARDRGPDGGPELDMFGAPVDLRLHDEHHARLRALQESALELRTPEGDDGALLGIEVAGFYDRRRSGVRTLVWGISKQNDKGELEVLENNFLPGQGVSLTMVPISSSGRPIGSVTQKIPVANEFESGIYEFDKNTVIIPLSVGQRLLRMGEGDRVEAPASIYDPAPPGVIEQDPPRVHTVMVKAVAGVSDVELRGVCREVYREFASAHEDVPSFRQLAGPERGNRHIATWADSHRMLVSAVETETVLVLFLFLIISLVAVFLILAIFWAMVSEKTRDVGTLRAIGASRLGIALVWICYGGAIGLVGAVLGMILSHAIVWNINPIHEWMGTALGVQVWDPKTYYMPKIPNEVDPMHALLVFLGGVSFSMAGAVVPALRAAWLNPVRALRFE